MNESLWSKIRRLWNERKRAKAKKRRDQGYAFAKRMLTQELMTTHDLYDKTCESECFGHYDDFDRGIRAAIYDWELRNVEAI